jgi:hypothetical protein
MPALLATPHIVAIDQFPTRPPLLPGLLERAVTR